MFGGGSGIASGTESNFDAEANALGHRGEQLIDDDDEENDDVV